MQIDRSTYLQIPRHHMPGASENESLGVPPRAGLTNSQSQFLIPAPEGKQLFADGVVLKIQFPDGGSTQATRAAGPVYTDGRKSAATDGDQADGMTQTADHQRAVDRNAGIFTQITLNKDGVLVAKPQPAGEAKQPDFVALAVSAMREFSDEADRQKAQSFDFNPPAAEMPWGKLKSLQQLAAKFNMFT
jgi:hypothetical protein